MTNFKPLHPCPEGFLCCNPVEGQGLGFCNRCSIQPVDEDARPADEDLPPLDIDFNEPTENKDGGMEMLAWSIILVIAIAILCLWRFYA